MVQTVVSSWQIWFEATRPRTLSAACAPVFVGTAVAWGGGEGAFVPGAACACLAFALLVQIGTNFANDYYDALKGADTAERVGPRRAVASGLVTPQAMRSAMIAVLAAAFLVGLTLLVYGGWPLLLVGVASIACAVAYTGGPYPLAYHGLGDLFVFIFFGQVAVVTTAFVQMGQVSLSAWVASVGVGALATNILVANNYRDVETDRKAHKRTLLVRWGRAYGRRQFAVAHALAVGTPLVLAVLGAAALWPAVAVAGLAAGVGWRQSQRLHAARTPLDCITLLGQTGKWLALYGVVLALAIGSVRIG